MAILRIYSVLLVFLSFKLMACQAISADAIKAKIESAFLNKSFINLLKSDIGAPSVKLVVEDEYDEDHPISKYNYQNLESFTKAFYSMERYTNSMIIPQRHVCHSSGCDYVLPRLTLHHATYLVAFSFNVKQSCLQTINISIYHA